MYHLLSKQQETVEQHQRTRSSDMYIPRDFIDAYLDEVKQQSVKNPTTTFTCKFDIKYCFSTI